MKLSVLLSTLLRRWYVVVAGLVVTLGVVLIAMKAFPVEYTANSQVVLLPPTNTLETVSGNPFRALGGLDLAGLVLARAVNAPDVVERLSAPDGSATYEVEKDVSTSGPIVLVRSQGRTESAVLAVQQTVLDEMSTTFAKMQTDSGAASNSLIRLSVITQDRRAEIDSKTQIRAVIVAAAIGLASVFLAAIGVDSFIARRARPKSVDSSARHAATISDISRGIKVDGSRSTTQLIQGRAGTAKLEREIEP